MGCDFTLARWDLVMRILFLVFSFFFFFFEQKDFVFSLGILFEHNGSDASLGQLVTCE